MAPAAALILMPNPSSVCAAFLQVFCRNTDIGGEGFYGPGIPVGKPFKLGLVLMDQKGDGDWSDFGNAPLDGSEGMVALRVFKIRRLELNLVNGGCGRTEVGEGRCERDGRIQGQEIKVLGSTSGGDVGSCESCPSFKGEVLHVLNFPLHGPEILSARTGRGIFPAVSIRRDHLPDVVRQLIDHWVDDFFSPEEVAKLSQEIAVISDEIWFAPIGYDCGIVSVVDTCVPVRSPTGIGVPWQCP